MSAETGRKLGWRDDNINIYMKKYIFLYIITFSLYLSVIVAWIFMLIRWTPVLQSAAATSRISFTLRIYPPSLTNRNLQQQMKVHVHIDSTWKLRVSSPCKHSSCWPSVWPCFQNLPLDVYRRMLCRKVYGLCLCSCSWSCPCPFWRGASNVWIEICVRASLTYCIIEGPCEEE